VSPLSSTAHARRSFGDAWVDRDAGPVSSETVISSGLAALGRTTACCRSTSSSAERRVFHELVLAEGTALRSRVQVGLLVDPEVGSAALMSFPALVMSG